MNIAHRISDISKLFPDKKSVVFSQRQKDGSYLYPSYTFKKFDELSSQMANRFLELGIKKGTRTLLFVTPCLDFSVITFALFKVGAIPVLIDPGMGIKNLLSSVKQVRPEALVSIDKVHWIRRILPAYFKNIKIKISLSPVGGRTHHLYQGLDEVSKSFTVCPMNSDDTSAILFTSGGTGIPKGVLYTHGILNAQTDALKAMFSLGPEETDLPGFPLFALFTLAMGMTSVIPDMDPTKPSQCNPSKIVQNILDNKSTFVAGSPAIWEKVGKYCVANNIKLESVKYVVMFGAPVRAEIHELFKNILTNGNTYTPYGATECLPVTLISGSDILSSKIDSMNTGSGTCIGKVVPHTEIKILSASDIPKGSLDELENGSIGEIVVRGKQVTSAYFDMDQETQNAKIYSGDQLWHRMGDIGWIDQEHNLWFLGRKSHRVELNNDSTLYPLEVEAIFNQHLDIKRTALVKIHYNGVATAGLVIERKDKVKTIDKRFHEELSLLKLKTTSASKISHFFIHSGFPVDVRHNIKIDRIKLSSWAQNRLNNV